MNQTLKQAFDQASQLSIEAQNVIAQMIFNEIKNHQTNQEQKLNLSDQEDSENHNLKESQEISTYYEDGILVFKAEPIDDIENLINQLRIDRINEQISL